MVWPDGTGNLACRPFSARCSACKRNKRHRGYRRVVRPALEILDPIERLTTRGNREKPRQVRARISS